METAARSQFRRAKKRPTAAAQPPPLAGMGGGSSSQAGPPKKQRRRSTTAAAAAAQPQIDHVPLASSQAGPPKKQRRRSTTAAAQPQIDHVPLALGGMEAALRRTSVSIPRRRRTRTSVHPAVTTNPPPHHQQQHHPDFPDLDLDLDSDSDSDKTPLDDLLLVGLVPCGHNRRDHNLGGDPALSSPNRDFNFDLDSNKKRARDDDDDSNKKLLLQQLPKRARSDLPPCPWRDHNLGGDPALSSPNRDFDFDLDSNKKRARDDDDDSNKKLLLQQLPNRARSDLPPSPCPLRDHNLGGDPALSSPNRDFDFDLDSNKKRARDDADDDDSDKKLLLLQQLPKRARSDLPPCPWRDWSGLGDGPAGLIAERVLAYDVADYVRFRAVCRPWRHSSTEPRAHDGLDRRFHPWRWTMLREELASPTRRCFLNTSTAECVSVDIPELHDHELLALTPEGLLILVHELATVCLLNPLTRHVTHLPPLTTLLPPSMQFEPALEAWGSGIASDDSTVVLFFKNACKLGVAKPGDDRWMLLNYRDQTDWITFAPLMFAGRLYCVDLRGGVGVMVLETGPDNQTPRFELAAKMDNIRVSTYANSVHLVDNFGELMLVHRHGAHLAALNKPGCGYDAYRVDLDAGTLVRVNSLGGRALFMGMFCSLSVSVEVFPSRSIAADTIYLSFDVPERCQSIVESYHLPDGRIQRAGLVPRPHTLVDCLCLALAYVE